MKRKLALLLAGVMTMTMLPMNLFAASSTAPLVTVGEQSAGTVLLGQKASTTVGANYQGFTNKSGDVTGVKKGTDLEITLNNDILPGDSLDVTLNNAEWFFRAPTTTIAGAYTTSDAITLISNAALALPLITNIFPGAATTLTSTGAISSAAVFSNADTGGTASTGGSYMGGYLGSHPTYATEAGIYVVPVANDVIPAQISAGYRGAYIGVTPGAATLQTINPDSTPQYVMGLSDGNASKATIYFTMAQRAGTKITIPLPIIVSDDDKDVSATLTAGVNSALTSTTVTIYSAGGGVTTASTDVKVARDTLALNTITVKESKLSTIKVQGGQSEGTFTIEASDGFRFDWANNFVGDNTTTKGGVLAFANFPSGWKYKIYDTNVTSSTNDVTSLTVSVSGLNASQLQRGEMYLKDFTLLSTDSDYFGNAQITITDGSPGLGLSNQTFTVAERKQYGITLAQTKSTDAVPTLITGRFPTSNTDTVNKAVNFKISENTLGSWWAERDTVIALPEGAKFRNVKITDVANITKGDTTGLVGSYPAGTESGDIYVVGNKLTIKSTAKKDVTKKATIEFEAWVSVSQTLADTDITLSVTGGGMDEASIPAPLVIAKAIAPVTIAATAVSEIKIGLQAQPTSNIVIKETTAGALQTDKAVQIKLTDIYGSLGNNDLVFANTAKIAVTEGNLDVSSLTVGQGTLSSTAGSLLLGATDELVFTIDKKSTKASTVTISDVTVKASRILPETDKDSYKVFVYGTAVAENYNSTKTGSGAFKTLADAGVYTDYIKVGAGVGNLASAAAEFKYSIAEGTTTYTVNGKELPLADDMKGYNKNGTVMVPIRLIAEGFGLDVHWNESNRTVIVDLSTTVKAEFPVGKTFMKVGGTQVDMLDANDNLVAAEITNDRSYVPFRQLGYAFGIASANMVWDQETSTVTFNPAK